MNDAAKEYGGALFELCYEEKIDTDVLNQVRVLNTQFKNDRSYLKLLSCPDIPKVERISCIDRLLKDNAHEYLINFMKLTVENGHATELIACFDEYEKLYYEYHNMVKAKVESAVMLSDSQKNNLKQKLSAITGKEVEIECVINHSLIAGMRLTVNNRLYEGSVRAKLDAIADSLASVTL